MKGTAQHKKGSISAHGVSDLPLVVSIAKGAMICSAAPALPAFTIAASDIFSKPALPKDVGF